VSVTEADRSNAIGESSKPETSPAVSAASSATPSTDTVKVESTEAVSPLSSVVVAVAVRSKSPEKLLGGVISSPSS
jgi:hypothetical protein